MSKTTKLTQAQLVEAIRQYMSPGTDIESVDFSRNYDNEVVAVVTERERPKPRFRPRRMPDGMDWAKAFAQQESPDAFTGETIVEGTNCIWLPGVGITVAHPDRWTIGVGQFSQEDRREMVEHLGLEKKQASAAADILGGSGGATDRGSALGRALKDV